VNFKEMQILHWQNFDWPNPIISIIAFVFRQTVWSTLVESTIHIVPRAQFSNFAFTQINAQLWGVE
jgi:hypothetical protein